MDVADAMRCFQQCRSLSSLSFYRRIPLGFNPSQRDPYPFLPQNNTGNPIEQTSAGQPPRTALPGAGNLSTPLPRTGAGLMGAETTAETVHCGTHYLYLPTPPFKLPAARATRNASPHPPPPPPSRSFHPIATHGDTHPPSTLQPHFFDPNPRPFLPFLD